MQIFEYPYVIITILFLVFIVLSLVGVYFAFRGIKTATGKEEKDFVTIGKLENSFEKSGKSRENRCIFYISLSTDKLRSLYSETRINKLTAELKNTLLESFSLEDSSMISPYGEKNYVVFSKWDMEEAGKNSEACIEKINKVLLNHSALNIIEIRIGSYFAFGTEVSFDEAISRAKQGYMLAEQQDASYAEWNVTSGKALEKKIKIENSIEKEIDNNRFFLEYQPVLDAKSKKIVGAEVLSRLNSESDGVLSPGSFLSAVDSVGITGKFDYYIFEKNCKWIANDKAQREAYTYTINFSRTTLCEPEFSEKITDIVQKYDLKFSCLAIEILEDKEITGEDKKTMIKNLTELKNMGMSVLLDDFGSGFTGYDDLQSIDISIVKIDRSITRNAVTDTGFKILKNIVSTAKDIGFETLCEGIETKEQEEAVIKAGCDYLQGFYYYKPMPVARLEKLFDKREGV